MVKNLIMYIFIYILLVGCGDTKYITEPPMNSNYYLDVTAPNLVLDENGYYHIEWIDGHLQTFSTLNAETGSETLHQKVHWISDSGIYESYTGNMVNCVNPASYTNDGVAHTVLSVWEVMIGDTITIYASYSDGYGVEYMDSIEVIVENEI